MKIIDWTRRRIDRSARSGEVDGVTAHRLRRMSALAVAVATFTATFALGTSASATESTAMLSVRVVTQDGVVLGTGPTFRVAAVSTTTNTWTSLTRVDAGSGVYAGEVPAADSYTLSVYTYPNWFDPALELSTSRPGYLGMRTTPIDLGTEPVSIDLVLPMALVEMSVTDEFGAPSPWYGYVLCSASNLPDTGNGYSYTSLSLIAGNAGFSEGFLHSDDDGHATFYAPIDTTCAANVQRSGEINFVPERFSVAAGPNIIEVQAPSPVELSGTMPVNPGIRSGSFIFSTVTPGASAKNYGEVSQDGKWIALVPPGDHNVEYVDHSSYRENNNQWKLQLNGSVSGLTSDQSLNTDFDFRPVGVQLVDSAGAAIDVPLGYLICNGYRQSGGFSADSVWATGTVGLSVGSDVGTTTQVPAGEGWSCRINNMRLDDGRVINTDAMPLPDAGIYVLSADLGRVVTPPAPVVVESVAPGNHSVTITWLKPASQLPILGYTVTATPGGQTCSTDSADELSCTITGLDNGVNYTFTVTAHSAAGESDPPTWAPPSTTPGAPPAQVTGVTPERDPGDGTQATVHWLAADSDPNYPIVGYTATASPGGHVCSTDGALSCTITGLTPGLDYEFTVTATNGIGSGDPSDSVDLLWDTTPPDVSGEPDRPANANDWYRAPVTVSWSAIDDIDGPMPAPPQVLVASEGANRTATSEQVCDTAGNCATGTLGGINIDTTDPVVTAASDRTPDSGSWYQSPVTVTFTCSDTLSGVASCSAPTTVTGDGADQVLTGTGTDLAGNSSTAQTTLSIDSQAPVVSDVRLDTTPLPVGDTAVLTATASDGLSGVAAGEWFLGADPGPGNAAALSFDGESLSAQLPAATAPGVYTVGVRARDNAGNWSPSVTAYLVTYDPNAGSATGGGWIIPGGDTSDPGDTLPGLDGTSKATFGFVVKYQNGQAIPSGNLQFKAGNLHLKSTSMDWLVVANNRARFQGLGQVDDMNGQVPFRVDAHAPDTASQPDRLEIRIWAEGADPDTDEPLYKATGDVGGGNIGIHAQ